MSKELTTVAAGAVVKADENIVTYGALSANLAQDLAEEMEGLKLKFDRMKIPSGGGVAYEVPSDNPDSPDMVKEFECVVLHDHTTRVYYKDKYTGGNTPPDCSSRDGKVARTADGTIKSCEGCGQAEWGSADDGGGKACKQRHKLYILRADEALPILFTIPTGSVDGFSAYKTRLLSKGKKLHQVVTKFSLRKAQNSGGITFSQTMQAKARDLRPDELAVIVPFASQIKAMAKGSAGLAVVGSDDDIFGDD